MTRIIAAIALAILSLPAVGVVAHEGHEHKIMGTVSAVQRDRLDVQDRDGKTIEVTLNEKTKLLRGTTKVTADDVTPGERVVVSAVETKGADGRVTRVATEVRLSAKRSEEARK